SSSIWATACSRRLMWTPCAPWSSRSMAGSLYAVLLMAYGGPGNLDEVEPYLRDVRGGRPTGRELIDEFRQRYERIGGGSPILPLTQAQGAALAGELRLPVYIGMRHWHPTSPRRWSVSWPTAIARWSPPSRRRTSPPRR